MFSVKTFSTTYNPTLSNNKPNAALAQLDKEIEEWINRKNDSFKITSMHVSIAASVNLDIVHTVTIFFTFDRPLP